VVVVVAAECDVVMIRSDDSSQFVQPLLHELPVHGLEPSMHLHVHLLPFLDVPDAYDPVWNLALV
jgi:hypothetical protein